VIEINRNKVDVSVILTVFNSRRYFTNAINSVLNQTYRNYELIIIDDGSSDEIETDLIPLLKVNDNFKYIRHSNRKHPLSLNTGLRLASGKFVTFLDSDDEYMPFHLHERINFFSENKNTDLIYSPALLIGDEKDFYVPDAKDKTKRIHIDDCIIGGTLFGKSEVFIALGGFRNIYSHDSDFFQRAKEKFNVMRFDLKSYIYKRNNPESITNIMMKEINEHR